MKIEYKDWVLDSEEELYFVYWLQQLQEQGYVETFLRVQEPILLFDKVLFNFTIDQKPITKPILRSMEYTPDFYIKWGNSSDGLFVAKREGEYQKNTFKNCIFYTDDSLTSIVDVKGVFKGTGLTSSITFPIIQKILAYKEDLFIQAVKPFGPKGLFAKTFTPDLYLQTKTGKQRKINWEVKTLEQYLNSLT